MELRQTCIRCKAKKSAIVALVGIFGIALLHTTVGVPNSERLLGNSCLNS